MDIDQGRFQIKSRSYDAAGRIDLATAESWTVADIGTGGRGFGRVLYAGYDKTEVRAFVQTSHATFYRDYDVPVATRLSTLVPGQRPRSEAFVPEGLEADTLESVDHSIGTGQYTVTDGDHVVRLRPDLRVDRTFAANGLATAAKHCGFSSGSYNFYKDPAVIDDLGRAYVVGSEDDTSVPRLG